MPHTVGSLIEAVSERFRLSDLSYGHGTDNAWDEAVALVLGVTGAPDDRDALSLPVTEVAHVRIMALAERRITERVPLPYLTGRCTYMGLEFIVEPGVIVPRSAIGELLVNRCAPWLQGEPQMIADVCSGTGCLGILAAQVFPGAQVVLLELDAAAAGVAARNVALHGLGDRVQVICCDVTEPWPVEGPFDLIVANPPYVDQADMRTLPEEYAAEPALALDGGSNGMAVMDPVLRRLPDYLSPGGLFVGEVGASAAHLVRAHPKLDFIWPDLVSDSEGIFLLEAGSSYSHTARPDNT